jgi:hypothetical protein
VEPGEKAWRGWILGGGVVVTQGRRALGREGNLEVVGRRLERV